MSGGVIHLVIFLDTGDNEFITLLFHFFFLSLSLLFFMTNVLSLSISLATQFNGQLSKGPF